MTSTTNNTVASQSSLIHLSTPDKELAAFDLLPPALRAMIRGMNIKMSAESILPHLYAGVTTAFVLECVIAQEAKEIAQFGREYQGIYGFDYPYTAASASVLRYGKIIPKPYRRRRRQL